MVDRFQPALPASLNNLKADSEGSTLAVVDQETGLPCRLILAAEGLSAGLALRQAHLTRVRLAHPGLAAAIGLAETAEGRWYRVEETVSWPDGDPSPDQLRSWLPAWLGALGHLHARGIIHGDLHPGALGLDPSGRPKLAGPGRGWRIGQIGEAPAPEHAAAAFAAPETLCQARVDARTDLYMLGAVCLSFLTGCAAPEDDMALAETLEALASHQPAWAELLNGMLAHSPAHRLASAADVLQQLASPTHTPAAPSGQVVPFVGRRPELERLLEALDQATDTLSPRVVTIHGAAGTGKSRLMEELRSRARARGFAVAVARVGDRDDGGPFAAWCPLIEALLSRVALGTQIALAPVLGAVLPGLGAEPAPALEPKAARMRLFAAIADLIESAAAPPGLLICLDDWHLADTASRELLDYLRRALPSVPLCVLLASRDSEPSGDDGAPDSLPLNGFSRRETQAFCRGVWQGQDPGGGWVAGLEAASSGNPGLLEVCAIACKAVSANATTPRQASAAIAALALPRTLEALWRTRLAALSPAANTLAAAAAVSGPRASLALLQGVSALDESDFFIALDELADSGFIVPAGDGHTLVAEAAVVLVEASQGETAERLAGMHAHALNHHRLAAQFGQPVAPSRLAHHALAAGLPHEGAHYALTAGQAALRLFALDDAGAYLTRAADCLTALQAQGEAVPAEWLLDDAVARGDLHRYRAQAQEAETLYRAALALAAEHAPARQADIATSLGITLNLASRPDEAERCYQQAIDSPTADDTARARATTALARMAVRLGRADEAVTLCENVLANPGASVLHQGEALGMLGLVHVNGGVAVAQGLEFLARAQTLAERTGDRLALSNACMLAGNARFGLGQLAPARASYERYALLCQELGLPDESACATLNLAQVAFEQGRYPEALQRARSGAQAAAELGNRIYAAFGQAHIALASAHMGYLAEAEAAVTEGLAIADTLGNDYMGLQVGVAQLQVLIFLGRLGRAEELGLSLLSRQETSGVTEFAGTLALLLGQTYELCGEVDAAVTYLRQARLHGEAGGNALVQSAAALGFGQVALRAGQIAVAQERGLDALALSEQAGASLPQLRANLLLAHANWLMGTRESAGAHLAAAEELAASLMSPHWQALVWLDQSRYCEGAAALRQKAATYIQYYTQQLPPRARQEFLNWPERRDAMSGRGTQPLDGLTVRVPKADPIVREVRP